jgi:hypothetical protein
LFGRVVPVEGAEEKEIWVVDVKRVIREMGKGMLLEENVSARRPSSRKYVVVAGLLLNLRFRYGLARHQKDEPNTVADFTNRWRMEVGDDFGPAVNLDMLKVSGDCPSLHFKFITNRIAAGW